MLQIQYILQFKDPAMIIPQPIQYQNKKSQKSKKSSNSQFPLYSTPINTNNIMFFDTISVMMNKQHIADYLFNQINILKINPSHQLQNFIVQVVGIDQISDSNTNFICKWKKTSPKKGSIIRLIKWGLDLKSYQIIIDQCQYLGGAGYGVKLGRPWDLQKVKIISNSSIASKDFVVLYNPIYNNSMSQKLSIVNINNSAHNHSHNNSYSNNQNSNSVMNIFKLPASKQYHFNEPFNTNNSSNIQNKNTNNRMKNNDRNQNSNSNSINQNNKDLNINAKQNIRSEQYDVSMLQEEQQQRINKNIGNIGINSDNQQEQVYSRKDQQQQRQHQQKHKQSLLNHNNLQKSMINNNSTHHNNINVINHVYCNNNQEQQKQRQFPNLTYSQDAILKVKKLKISQDIDKQQQQIINSLTIRHMIRPNNNNNDNNNNNNHNNNSVNNAEINDINGDIDLFQNQDNFQRRSPEKQKIQENININVNGYQKQKIKENGRQFVFNKQQINRLLGKQ